MSSMYRAWAQVDLDALAHNINEIKKITNAKILAVVKADAYGHGFLEASRTFLAHGAAMLGVATVDEAVQLRENEISAPILILGGICKDEAQKLVAYDIMPTVYTYEMAKVLSDEAGRQNKTAKIHIKVDTGMNRLGFLAADEAGLEQILSISRLPNLVVDGVFTHFACADEKDASYTHLQFEKFLQVCKKLTARGLTGFIRHACNSAATMMFPEMHLDMVRPGIILYGLYPSDEVDKSRLSLRPAMTLKANITHIKEVGEGERVSYGGRFTTTGPTKIATVSVGYADGYSRILSNQAKMIVADKKVPVIGTICMDQCMIDVTSVQNISVGDEAILFGRWDKESISVEEIAQCMGTINYEVLCVIGKRIPRVYINGGKIVNVLNYLV